MRASTWVIIGALALLLTGGGAVVFAVTRGLRNNNPLNIRRGNSQWLGMREIQTDPEFVQFVSPEYGIRAARIILTGYRTRYGLSTLRQWISKWAPPNENDTASYVDAVSARSGLAPDAAVLDVAIPRLLEAMIQHENGLQPYQMATIESGVKLA